MLRHLVNRFLCLIVTIQIYIMQLLDEHTRSEVLSDTVIFFFLSFFFFLDFSLSDMLEHISDSWPLPLKCLALKTFEASVKSLGLQYKSHPFASMYFSVVPYYQRIYRPNSVLTYFRETSPWSVPDVLRFSLRIVPSSSLTMVLFGCSFIIVRNVESLIEMCRDIQIRKCVFL